MTGTTEYYIGQYDVISYTGLYHEPPAPTPEDVLEDARQFRSSPRRYHWTVDDSPGREKPDLAFSFGGELVMSSRAAGVLIPLIEPWVWLEKDVTIDGQAGFVAAVLTVEYDAMDQSASVGTRGKSSGVWMSLNKLVLNRAQLGPAPIFRISTRALQWRPVLSRDIVQTISKNNLTGISFMEAEIR